MDPVNLIQCTVEGLMPLIGVDSTGGYLAHKKIFTMATVERLSVSYANFFNPAFIFFHIAGSFDAKKVSQV